MGNLKMTEQGNTQDLSSLDSRVAAVRKDMDAALATAVKRRNFSLIMLVVVVVIAVFMDLGSNGSGAHQGRKRWE